MRNAGNRLMGLVGVLVVLFVLAAAGEATLVLRDFQGGTPGNPVPNAGAGWRVSLTTHSEGANRVARWAFLDNHDGSGNPWWWGEDCWFAVNDLDGSAYDTLEFKFKPNVTMTNLGVRVMNNGSFTMNWYGIPGGISAPANIWSTIRLDISGIAKASKNDIERIDFFTHWGWQHGSMVWLIDDIQLVPEPQVCMLAGLAGLAMLRRRRK